MNRVHTLSNKEMQKLKQLNRDPENAGVRTRCDMILLSNEGLSSPKIGQRVRFSHESVVRLKGCQHMHQNSTHRMVSGSICAVA